MSRGLCRVITFFVLLLPGRPAGAADEDLQEEYGTSSAEAASHLDRASVLARAKQWPEALREVDAAVGADPSCAAAHYRRGTVLMALGKVDEGLDAWGRAYFLAPDSAGVVTVNAAIDAGTACARLGRQELARQWLSRAILADPDNLLGLRGKAWRHMGECCRTQGQHFAASLAELAACIDDPADSPAEALAEDREKGKAEETARLISVPWDLPKFPARDVGRLLPVPIEGDVDVTDTVRQILPDPKGGGLVVIVADKPHYYLVTTTGKLVIRRIDLPGRAICGAVAAGRLYVMCGSPYALHVMDPAVGKPERSWDLGWLLPNSLAPFPSQGVVYFATACGRVHRLDMVSGEVVDTDVPGHRVASEPTERYLFVSMTMVGVPKWFGFVLVNDTLLSEPDNPAVASVLVKYLLVRGELLAAEVRRYAMNDADGLVVSPDGQWVTVTSEAGRPTEGRPESCSLQLLSAHNGEYRHALFTAPACPWNLAVNPVTGQVAISHEWYVRVAQMENERKAYAVLEYVRAGSSGSMRRAPVFLEGKFARPMAWSPGGEYLVVAKAGGGLCAYVNTLSDAEKRLALTWWKGLAPEAKPLSPGPADALDLPPPAPPIPALADFKVVSTRAGVAEALKRAIASGRTVRPPSWRRCSLYIRNEDLLLTLGRVDTGLKYGSGAGAFFGGLWNRPPTGPEATWTKLYLGNCHAASDAGRAKAEYLACVHTDRGRTDVTPMALNALAAVYLGDRNHLGAACCLATSLLTDRANPETLAAIYPLLKGQNLDADAATLARLYPRILLAPSVLPTLATPKAGVERLSPDRIYAKVVPSVVLIQSRRRSGTGFCVGAPGILLTTDQATRGQDTLDVYPFRIEDGKPVRTRKLVGEVIARWQGRGLAVVRVTNPPPTLTALDVAAANPSPGERVFAIGNPGLGIQVLEQSIGEGLVSSVGRVIRGNAYLQHTIAVSPGSAGGPLLNDRGQVVGVNAHSTILEGVGFAVPVEEVRKLFPKR